MSVVIIASRDLLGPTGQHPEGKLKADDEGELTYAVDRIDDKVEIQFGTHVKWLAMHPEQARQLAACLIDVADQIDKGEA